MAVIVKAELLFTFELTDMCTLSLVLNLPFLFLETQLLLPTNQC